MYNKRGPTEPSITTERWGSWRSFYGRRSSRTGVKEIVQVSKECGAGAEEFTGAGGGGFEILILIKLCDCFLCLGDSGELQQGLEAEGLCLSMVILIRLLSSFGVLGSGPRVGLVGDTFVIVGH